MKDIANSELTELFGRSFLCLKTIKKHHEGGHGPVILPDRPSKSPIEWVSPRASLQHSSWQSKQANSPISERVQVFLGSNGPTFWIEGIPVTRSIPLFQAGLGSESVAPRAPWPPLVGPS